jgi:protein kinase-like protein
MASLAHTIHAFQTGDLSPKEFFTQIDRDLVQDPTETERLLEILTEEHTKLPLPPEVFDEVHRRIESRAGPEQGTAADLTRMQTKTTADPRLAQGPSMTPGVPAGADTEQLKGVGDTINGRFLLEECLGFGGMGTVYKALDLRKVEASDRNPYIAIKVLNVQFRGHPKSLIALQREAKKAQALAHPNIVTVFDFDREGPMVYLTMEYLSGKPLSRVLRAPDFRGMSYAEALPIITGMANALSYAHERGFVHCDFKPANVFLTNKGQVKVIDFGIARVFRRSEEEAEATVFDAGSLGGVTPAYASPEMLEHREPDPRDDVYALACISYELLTGQHPFGRVPATQARSAGTRPLRPKSLPARQWRALKCALSFDREERTPTVAHFLQEMRGERKFSLPMVAGVASLAVAALVAVLMSSMESREGPVEKAAAPEPAPEPAPVAKPEAPPAPVAAPAPPAAIPALSLAAVSPVLAQVPCAALTASINQHALRVQGYLPERFGLARLRGELTAVPGVSSLNADVLQVGDDKCSVIETFAPYWVRNREAGRPSSVRARAPNAEFAEGDSLILDVTTPGYETYVHVDYYVLDGSVVHLVPSRRAKANQAPPNYKAAIGTLAGWTISKPFGTEFIVLLTSPVPIFDALRPESESRADYLHAVEQRLRQIAAKHGADKIAADFVQIKTHPR